MTLAQQVGLTDAGRKRRRNEDAYVCRPPLFAIADGMGGAQAGEIASKEAVDALLGESDGDGASPEEHVVALIQDANRRVYERAAGDEAVSGMGTTMTVALVVDPEVWIGHVGDSRAYLIRGGRLEQLTEDHSLVAELVRSGKLSPEEAETHPQRSVITRVLGTDPDVDVDTFSVPARPGDVFMLCSDGLTSMVADDRILELVEKHRKDLKKAAKALIDAANKSGGEDNITIVLFEIGDRVDDTLQLETAAPAPGEEDTLTEADAVPPVRLAQAREEPRRRRRPHLGIRWRWVAAGVLLVLVAAAAVGVWGLSRSYFVGAQPNGRVAVYQGVPWNITGGVRLYRLRYESPLIAAELSQAERKRLFDHHLVSYGDALRSVKRYEQDIVP